VAGEPADRLREPAGVAVVRPEPVFWARMRSLGLPELIIIGALLLLLFGGRRTPSVFRWAGKRAGSTIRQVKWIFESLGGSEESEVRAEQDVGAELAREFLAQMPLDPDPETQAVVERVGARLAKTPEARSRRFRYQVVQAPLANAYALPGGYVFVTRPMMDLCGRDEDALAVLLGHETAHIVCRHLAERKVVDTVLGAVRAGGVAHKLLGSGYSQQQELEADRKGAELALEAGFDREAPLRLLRKLESLKPAAGELTQYFSTHPRTEERIRETEEYLRGPAG